MMMMMMMMTTRVLLSIEKNEMQRFNGHFVQNFRNLNKVDSKMGKNEMRQYSESQLDEFVGILLTGIEFPRINPNMAFLSSSHLLASMLVTNAESLVTNEEASGFDEKRMWVERQFIHARSVAQTEQQQQPPAPPSVAQQEETKSLPAENYIATAFEQQHQPYLMCR